MNATYIPPAARLTPAAWLGFKIDPGSGELFVRICCACPDRREAEAEARRLNCRATHTLCDAHYAEQMAELTGDHSGDET